MNSPNSSPPADQQRLSDLFAGWSELWKPRERLPLSDWAEKHFVLSAEYSGRTGPLKLYGWQRGPLDAFTDPTVSEIWLMCGTQLLKTLFLQAAIAYTLAEEPGPILVLQPKEADAESFSKERIGPMLRDIPALAAIAPQAQTRTKSNTILEKTFQNGAMLALAGAVSPGNVARRAIKVFAGDEVDKYPASAGNEGDVLSLGDERTATFGSRAKKIRCCSPTIRGRSRIGKGYEASDQRKPWVPCPACGAHQILEFSQVVWSDDDPGTARYQCKHCEARWNDVQRWAACELADWRADAPFKGIAGFWISHLYSPWKKLETIVAKYLLVKDDPEQYKTFVNTNLAELYEASGETPDEDALMARREDYPCGANAQVPQRGLFLTCAVDVQESPPRLEYEVVAWGRNRECWSLDVGTIQVLAENDQPLPVTSPELWFGNLRPGQAGTSLQALLDREFVHESGQKMPILAMAIDTGKRPAPVREFARAHAQPVYGAGGMQIVAARTVVPIKGNADAIRVISTYSRDDAARKHGGVRIVTIGTHRIKQEIYDCLRSVEPRPDGGPVIGCMHHPMGSGYQKPYFESLCGEERIVKQDGKVEWKKRPNRRNEGFDLKGYNRACYSMVGADEWGEDKWLEFERAVAPKPETPPPQAPQSGPRPSFAPVIGKIRR